MKDDPHAALGFMALSGMNPRAAKGFSLLCDDGVCAARFWH
jgi:hypothetical protein